MEVAFLFEPVEKGVEAAGADTVAMAGELFDHAEAEDRFFDGMVQDVEANQAGIEIAVRGRIRIL